MGGPTLCSPGRAGCVVLIRLSSVTAMFTEPLPPPPGWFQACAWEPVRPQPHSPTAPQSSSSPTLRFPALPPRPRAGLGLGINPRLGEGTGWLQPWQTLLRTKPLTSRKRKLGSGGALRLPAAGVAMVPDASSAPWAQRADGAPTPGQEWVPYSSSQCPQGLGRRKRKAAGPGAGWP